MNSPTRAILLAFFAFAAGALLSFFALRAYWKAPAKTGSDDTAQSAQSAAQPAPANSGLVMDAQTQKRINLKTDLPAPAHWQTQLTAFGRVMEPAKLLAAVTELETLRTAADASGAEYRRLQTLSQQDNVAARALESAKAAAEHDRISVESSQQKLALDWGRQVAGREDLDSFVKLLTAGGASLVRLGLPPGNASPPFAPSARLVVLSDESRRIEAQFVEALPQVDPQTQERLLLYLVTNQALPAGAAVTGSLEIPGQALQGVAVPASAVLRYEGKGWVYVQSAENHFRRQEIPLDRPLDNGWFVPGNWPANARIVVTGVETVFSEELKGSNFTTGQRD
jgi:hypothetical protein